MESIRTALLQEIHQYGDDELHPTLLGVIEHYIHRPAQYFRARLLQDAARIYAGAPLTPAVERLMVGVELLHLFALIHDDWLDREEHPHRPPAEATGEALLLAGDIVHAMGMEVIHQTVSSYGLHREITRIVARAARITISGQMRELHRDAAPRSREELYQLYDQKTGFYTAVAPLQTGALAVAGPLDHDIHEDLPVLQALGLLIGRAYQLRDDLMDLTEDSRTLQLLRGENGTKEIERRVHEWLTDLEAEAAPWITQSNYPQELAELVHRSLGKERVR